jgi:signal transduction histidine kinase
MFLRRRILVAILFALSLATPACASGDLSTRGVLIIDEYGPDSRFAQQLRESIHSTLDDKLASNYEVYVESLDVARFDGFDHDVFRAYFGGKYKTIPISVIVTVGAEALKFASRIRADFWPTTPIVFVTIGGASDILSSTPPNATGSILTRRFQDVVESARLIVPRLAQIVLIGNRLQPLRPYYADDQKEVAKNLKILDLSGLPFADVLTRIVALPDDAAIFYTPFSTDRSGLVHGPMEAIRTLTAVANRPIIVDSETPIGTGVVGGRVPSPQRIGHDAAVKVARILDGETVGNIPITIGDASKPVFDSRQLERWGVDLATLPVGSDIRFRETNIWDQYYWYIVAACALFVIQTLAIFWFFHERSRRQLAEEESHQHLLEVTQLDRAMTASAMSTSIAHELSQPLSAIQNNAEAGALLLDADSLDRAQLKEICTDIYRDNERAVAIIKHLRQLLKQSELQAQSLDLAEAIGDALEILQPKAKEEKVIIQFRRASANLCVRADPIHLQQVILNLGMNAIDAMQNISADRKITLEIQQQHDDALVSIEDTGTGIPPETLNSIFKAFVTTKAKGTGLGLSIARTIIETYGGRLWAENRAEGGAAFHFTLKLCKELCITTT